MDEKKIGFSIELDETHLNEIEDVYNSNIEVFVTLQDGFPLSEFHLVQLKIQSFFHPS